MNDNHGRIGANTPLPFEPISKVKTTPTDNPANSKSKITPSNCATKGQSKSGSVIESFFNILIGFWFAVLAQIIVFPWFEIIIDLPQNMLISFMFTAVSLARSYALRRFFNMIEVRKNNGK